MKTIVTLSLMIGILAGCSQSTDQAALRSEIEEANQEFMKAFATHDGNAVAAMYTDDATVKFPNVALIEGKENIGSFFQQAISSGVTSVKLTTEEVTGTDEFAIESGRYEMFVGDKPVDQGDYLVHWKKVGGKWLLHRDMPSTDAALPMAMAQPDQKVAIAIFKVKKGNGQKFEGFVKDVLVPACDVSTPGKNNALKSVRMLRANEPEKDGSEKYIFVFDPVSDEFEYGIEEILVKKHGAQKGKELNNEFSSLTTSFYEYHDMTQLQPIF